MEKINPYLLYNFSGMLWIGPGFNALYTGYWHYYNQLPADVREKVDSGEDGVSHKIYFHCLIR